MRPIQSATAPAASRWDRIGMSLSGICAIHCVLTPLVFAVLPIWSTSEAVHAWLHPALAVLIVPVTMLAIRGCLRRHGPRHVPVLLALGLAFILAAALAHDLLGEGGETLATLSGSALLIAGHWRNRCTCDDEHAC